MPDDPAGQFIFRHFNLETTHDFNCLIRLLQEVERRDQDGEDVSEAALRASLKWRGHDPEKDRWLAFHRYYLDEAIGSTVLYAQSPQSAALHIAVHPDWRRMGLGKDLFMLNLERARELGVCQILSNANARNVAAVAFLHRQGFHLAGSAWSLHLPVGQLVTEPEFPAGFTVQRYNEILDLTLLTNLLNQCYADHWGHAENIPGVVDETRVLRSLEYWRPENLFIAFLPDGRAVGVCESRPASSTEEDHLLGAPGIVPAYRSPGLYRALCLTAANWLRRYGPQAIRVESNGDGEDVIAIYQELGFNLDGRFLSYLYELK